MNPNDSVGILKDRFYLSLMVSATLEVLTLVLLLQNVACFRIAARISCCGAAHALSPGEDGTFSRSRVSALAGAVSLGWFVRARSSIG